MTPQQEALERVAAGKPLLPLTEGQALAHGRRLRAAGVHYSDIAKVMAVTHGVPYSKEWWRRNLRARGAPAAHYSNGNLRLSPSEHREVKAGVRCPECGQGHAWCDPDDPCPGIRTAADNG